MAEAARTVNVHVEYLWHETGLWCNTCMLSTGIQVWVAIRGPQGMHLQPRLWCYEHQGSRGIIIDDGGS